MIYNSDSYIVLNKLRTRSLDENLRYLGSSFNDFLISLHEAVSSVEAPTSSSSSRNLSRFLRLSCSMCSLNSLSFSSRSKLSANSHLWSFLNCRFASRHAKSPFLTCKCRWLIKRTGLIKIHHTLRRKDTYQVCKKCTKVLYCLCMTMVLPFFISITKMRSKSPLNFSFSLTKTGLCSSFTFSFLFLTIFFWIRLVFRVLLLNKEEIRKFPKK